MEIPSIASTAKSSTKTTVAPKTKYKKKRQFCPNCPQSYSKREYLQKHMKIEHDIELEKKRPGREPLIPKSTLYENDPRPYKCDQCAKEYKKSKHLARHKRTHLEQYCNDCQTSISNYVDHMLKVHRIELPRPFECEVCKKCYRTKANIKAHMRIHRVENRIYNCTVCTKSFFFSTDLRKHMKSHSQNRSVICDICGDAFKSADTLKCHMRRHTGERPYKCSQCPRAFSTSNSLDIHFRTHTGEKPFECEFCKKCFSDTSTLHVHKRLHTNDNPYQCHLCDRRTKQASNLRSHYKHFHRNNDITGRQIRLNSRILNRFSQSEIEAHLKQYGDLLMLIEQGLTEHNREENEKNNQIEKALEIINVPRQKAVEESRTEFKSEGELILEPDSELDAVTLPIEKDYTSTISKTSMVLVKLDGATTNKLTSIKCENEFKDEDPSNTEPHLIESVFIEDATGQVITINDEIKMEQSTDEYDWPSDIGDSDYDYIPPVEFKPETLNQKIAEKENATESLNTVKKSDELKKPSTRSERIQKAKMQRRCKPCDRSFHDIRKHMVEMHSSIARPFECYVCRKVYKRFDHLRYHMKTHGDERNYVCHFCAEAFFLNSDLRKHIMNRHQEDRPFECEECGKCFKNRHALTIHKRTHSGVKPYVCFVCSEAFASCGSLRIHERKHTGDKPYVCSYCKKAFADSSTHRQHVRIHTGDKPYCCHLCGRRTAQAGNLKSHYRHFHKVIVKRVTMFDEDSQTVPVPYFEPMGSVPPLPSITNASRIEE